MKIDKQPVATTITLSLTFEEGVVTVATAHAAPISLRSALACKLTKDEARHLAAELNTWASA